MALLSAADLDHRALERVGPVLGALVGEGLVLDRPPDRVGHDQVALDVPTAPGEEVEPGLALGMIVGTAVAIEHAERAMSIVRTPRSSPK